MYCYLTSNLNRKPQTSKVKVTKYETKLNETKNSEIIHCLYFRVKKRQYTKYIL